MEIVIAVGLFIGVVVSWLALPSGKPAASTGTLSAPASSVRA